MKHKYVSTVTMSRAYSRLSEVCLSRCEGSIWAELNIQLWNPMYKINRVGAEVLRE